jgi:hypothetical protein
MVLFLSLFALSSLAQSSDEDQNQSNKGGIPMTHKRINLQNTPEMYQTPYYTEQSRGLIQAYDNKFNVSYWEPWLTYDAHASADRLKDPTLIICSEAAALPAGAHAYIQRTRAPVKAIWLDEVNQFDFYDPLSVPGRVGNCPVSSSASRCEKAIQGHGLGRRLRRPPGRP